MKREERFALFCVFFDTLNGVAYKSLSRDCLKKFRKIRKISKWKKKEVSKFRFILWFTQLPHEKTKNLEHRSGKTNTSVFGMKQFTTLLTTHNN